MYLRGLGQWVPVLVFDKSTLCFFLTRQDSVDTNAGNRILNNRKFVFAIFKLIL